MNFVLYPIYGVAEHLEGDPLDQTRLPFDVTEGVRIENLRGRFRDDAFEMHTELLGTEMSRKLRTVQFGLVHRLNPDPILDPETGQKIGERQESECSETLVRQIAACLRLIRPMRQEALLMRGNIREDGSFDVRGLDVPQLHLIEVPEVQKLFTLRGSDADDLRRLAPAFLQAMRGEFWKFRMAVQFHDLGHFQSLDWKARYLLWCSAIESIYTSHNREHRGSMVAKARIIWFLGDNRSIYAPGDLPGFLQDPHITVGQIVNDLYEMRNFIAHGDKLPDRFFRDIPREGFNGGVRRLEVLLEAVSFIVRSSLLKILGENLLCHFADAAPAEAYFGGQHLTHTELRAARAAASRSAQPGL